MFKATGWTLLACMACAPTVAPDKTDEDVDGDSGLPSADATAHLGMSYYMSIDYGVDFNIGRMSGVRPQSQTFNTPWTTEHVWIAPADLPVLSRRDLVDGNYGDVAWTRQPFSDEPLVEYPDPLVVTPPSIGDWILVVRVVVNYNGEELIGSARRTAVYEPPETDTGTVVAYPEPPWEAFSYNYHTWFHVTPAPTRADAPPTATPTLTPTIAERVGAVGP